jgi:hypothetical protein
MEREVKLNNKKGKQPTAYVCTSESGFLKVCRL